MKRRRDFINVPEEVKTELQFMEYIQHIKTLGNPVLRSSFPDREIISYEEGY